jgi:DNA repair exonuclease SbcCD nuclease subunit
MKAIVISDLHIGVNPFKEWIVNLEKNLDEVYNLCVKFKMMLIILGDIFNSPNPSNEDREFFYRWIGKCEKKIIVVIISGNHDKVSIRNNALKPLKELNLTTVNIFDSMQLFKIYQLNLICIPHIIKAELQGKEMNEVVGDFILDNIDNKNINIVLSHAHYSGGVIGSEQKILKGGAVYLDEIKKDRIQKIFSGHLHSHQTLYDDLVIYPGSMQVIDFAERNDEKGYIVYDFFTNEWKFEKYKKQLEWKQVIINLIDKKYVDLDENKIKKSVEGKFIKIVFDIKEENKKIININDVLSVFKKYCTIIRHEVNIKKIEKEKVVKEKVNYNPIKYFESYVNKNIKDKKQLDFVLKTGEKMLSELVSEKRK